MSGDAKPTINLNALESKNIFPPKKFPGVFNKNHIKPYHRLNFSNKYFPNAKKASMLEKGWKKIYPDDIKKGMKGLYIEYDGPERKVVVITSVPVFNNKSLGQFEFRDTDYKTLYPNNEIDWEFYVPVAPVPFVRRGGSRKHRTRKLKKRA